MRLSSSLPVLSVWPEMTMLSPEWIRSVLPASEYQKALAVIEENLDLILNDATTYDFWNKRI